MKSHVRIPSMFLALLMIVIGLLVIPGAAGAQGIPWAGPTLLPDYIGAPAKAHPLPNSRVPQNPLLAPNPFNSVHEDTWNSDVVDIPGPLGRNPVVFSSTLLAARAHQDPLSVMYQCMSITFDSHGRLVAGCGGLDEASVALIDPESLAVLSSYQLPAVQGDLFANLLPASYNYLDNRDRFAISIADNKIITLVEGGSAPSPALELERTYDVSMYVPVDKRVSGLMLDWQGRMWFYLSGSLATADSPAIA